MSRLIHIGTRNSKLALWQAASVAAVLHSHCLKTNLVPVRSEGDLDQHTPLYRMGIQGVFTRHLDAALLQNKIDIAVHSMKDVPTVLANGLHQIAVLKRGAFRDVLLFKNDLSFLDNPNAIPVIATGSVRRRAQWLNRYPSSILVQLRGNIDTRLKKLKESDWDGALFAQAGLERINLLPEKHYLLDWMLPAPAQGAIVIIGRKDDPRTSWLSELLNDENTDLCTRIERDFLSALMGGCTTPISALAQIEGNEVIFRGNVLTPDGKKIAEVTQRATKATVAALVFTAVEEIMQNGGQDIVNELSALKIRQDS